METTITDRPAKSQTTDKAENQKSTEINNLGMPLAPEVKSFFERVRQDGINDRKTANQLLGEVTFTTAEENGKLVLKEKVTALDNKQTIRDVGRVQVGQDGSINTEELQYFAKGRDGSNVMRKTDQTIRPTENGETLVMTSVYEGATKDNFSPTEMKELTRDERIKRDGKEVSSQVSNFNYDASGKLTGETVVSRRPDGSVNTLQFAGEQLRIKSDVTVYPDSTKEKPHQESKTYEDILDGNQVVGRRLVNVAQKDGITTQSNFTRNVNAEAWVLEQQTRDKGNGPEKIYPR
jgi:hypothetical protein